MHIVRLIVVVVAFAALGQAAAAAETEHEHATAAEAVKMVRRAVALLERGGEAGLRQLHGKASAFVWKDSYVFVSDCAKGIILVNPFQPDRVGKPIADGPTYGGVTAAQRAQEQCETARKPGGGWWAYSFAHPGAAKPTRKVSYMTMVPGRSWLVGAGVYDDTTPLATFEEISRTTP